MTQSNDRMQASANLEAPTSGSQVAYMDAQESDVLTPRETLLLLCGFAAILASAAPWIVL